MFKKFCKYLQIDKIEFWCELTIAMLIWEDVYLCFGQECTLTSMSGGEGIKI